MKDILLALHHFPPDFSGSGLRAKKLSERMADKYGFRYRIFCERARFSRSYPDDAKTITRIRTFSEQGILFPFYMLYGALRSGIFLWRRRKEVGHIHFFSFSWMNRLIMAYNTIFLKRKTILEVTLDGSDDPMSLLETGTRNRMLSFFTHPLLKRIDRFIVGSQQSVDSCIKAGIDGSKVLKLPHPCEKKTFGSIGFDKKDELKKKLGLPGKFIMFNVGRIQERKDQDFLLDCMIRLDDEGIALVLAGPYDENDLYYARLRDKAREKGIGKRVFFMGRRDDIDEFMIASDLFVFSSRSEGFPNVIAESIMSGLPVITTYFECISEYITEHTGIMMDEDIGSRSTAVDKFSEAIGKVFKKKVTYDRQEIRDFGIKHLSTDRVDAEYDRLYRELEQGRD